MTHHACDLCQADAPRPLPQDPRIAVCGGCGFVYVPERRSSAEIAASWGEIYATGAYSPEWPAVKARLYYVAEWLDQNIGLVGKSLLDIGAGRGQFMTQARRRGASCYGIEPAADGRQHDIWPESIESCTLSERFDIVTINWTLENTSDPMAMLRFARAHVKPEGWGVVATGSRLGPCFKKPLSKYLNPALPADLHATRWDYQSLYRAMGAAGLELTKFNPYEECDWLVVAGKPDEVAEWAGDTRPQEVLDYFTLWATVCP